MRRLAMVVLLSMLAACESSRESTTARDETMRGGAGSATDSAAAVAAIDSVAATFVAAYNRDDAAAIAALHTENIFFVNGGTVEEGRVKLEEGWKGALPNLSDLKITVLDRVVGGNLAAETIRFTQQYRNQGKVETDSGYAVSVLRRGPDGSWRYHAHALSRTHE